MNPARKRKIYLILFTLIVISIASGLVLYALRQNINLFYTPTQIVEGKAPLNQPIHVGGMVEKGSIIRAKKGLGLTFKITDFNQTLLVRHTGILPDLFREGQGVVVEGQLLDKHSIEASRVLAKHDANYMPPEVKAALGKKVIS
jgi:cytochrome c-type biogenesis protein CcmE